MTGAIAKSVKHVRVGLVFLIVSTGDSVGQTSPKPFTIPDNNRAINPLVASDVGCAKDLSKASKMEGLELRKFLFDLQFYGCIQRADGVYSVTILDVRSFGEDKIPFRRVRLINMSDAKTIEGWVPAVEFHLDVLIQRLEELQKR